VIVFLTLNLPTTTIVAQPFNVIKWQLKFNLVAYGLNTINQLIFLLVMHCICREVED